MIKQITLSNYRNYDSMRLNVESAFVQITGPNGAGKTNILESLSYLSPGRGLRSADTLSVTNTINKPQGWSVVVETADDMKLQTGIAPDEKRRHVHIQGEKSSQSDLANYIAVAWLTPQMDGLFLAGASERRRFFDRMAYMIDPAHAGRLTRYEKALRNRNKLLKDNIKNLNWYESLESVMAETAVTIAATRLQLLAMIKEQLSAMVLSDFAKPDLAFNEDSIERALENGKAVQVENNLLQKLSETRENDLRYGITSVGAHKTDIVAHHSLKRVPADQCSTGEQKAMLISLILAQADLAQQLKDRPLVILLDDIAAHLDQQRQNALINYLSDKKLQCWVTGVEKMAIEKECQNFVLVDGLLKVA